MEKIDYEKVLAWIGKHETPIRIPTLGFNSYIDVSLSEDRQSFQITGRHGATKLILRESWNCVLTKMPGKDVPEERRCITSYYNGTGDRFAPGIVAVCREYWREQRPCPIETCKKRHQCINNH